MSSGDYRPGGASTSEKSATTSPAQQHSAAATASASDGSPAQGSASGAVWTPKLRSCVVCRSRKVRCDKQSPCSNCRRAGIACVVPSNDRPPRWARRLERVANSAAATATALADGQSLPILRQQQQASRQMPNAAAAGQVMDRLQSLEGLVKELSGQLEQANAAVAAAQSSTGGSSAGNSPGVSAPERDTDHAMSSSTGAKDTGLQKHFGRMVLQDSSRSHYIGTAFWSRISDEIEGLKQSTQGLATGDSDTSDDDEISERSPPSTHESGRTPSERHSFLFGHNLGGSPSDLREYRPLPSQVSFLLEIFSENVNALFQIVHMPTITKMLKGKRTTDMSHLSPVNEALMFSIYYAAVTSMEEEDVSANFGSSKTELNLKFRLGLEQALSRADFLNSPNLTLVQAFTIFVFLLRRHDSPRFVWMMAGLAIRMAQSVGLQRDGSNFPNLSPYEVEMRRRVWWALCMVDIRASEDQASEYTIPSGSFDTKLPLNINDADIDADTKETPAEHHGLTDMSMALASYEMAIIIRQMMAPRAKGEAAPTVEEQGRLLSDVYVKLDRTYLQYATEAGNIAYWVGVVATRLVISKLSLFIYLPTLFSSPNDHFSDEIRNKLLVAALEVAEYNHSLNAEPEARHWRWLFQTYTHWYSIVYLLLEASRRPWSPMVERSWIALHSSWLIPTQAGENKNLHIWVPLRKLMAKARKHREAEIERLRGCDEASLAELERADADIPVPASSDGPFKAGDANGEQLFRQHWRSLFGRSAVAESRDGTGQADTFGASSTGVGMSSDSSNGQNRDYGSILDGQYGTQASGSTGIVQLDEQQPFPSVSAPYTDGQMAFVSQSQPQGDYQMSLPADWSTASQNATNLCPGVTPWLWAEGVGGEVGGDGVSGVPMDLDVDVDWNNWLQSAANLEQGW